MPGKPPSPAHSVRCSRRHGSGPRWRTPAPPWATACPGTRCLARARAVSAVSSPRPRRRTAPLRLLVRHQLVAVLEVRHEKRIVRLRHRVHEHLVPAVVAGHGVQQNVQAGAEVQRCRADGAELQKLPDCRDREPPKHVKRRARASGSFGCHSSDDQRRLATPAIASSLSLSLSLSLSQPSASLCHLLLLSLLLHRLSLRLPAVFPSDRPLSQPHAACLPASPAPNSTANPLHCHFNVPLSLQTPVSPIISKLSLMGSLRFSMPRPHLAA